MARYTRMQIQELCKQIESDANAILTLHPAISGRMKTVVMLLRLTTQLSDIKELEASSNVVNLSTARRH